MRYGLVLIPLLLAACGGHDDAMTRNFGVSRDSAPDTAAASQVPLSVPPIMMQRPEQQSVLAQTQNSTQTQSSTQSQNGAQTTDQSALSGGQQALVDAAGPLPSGSVRKQIDDSVGLVYPSPGFVDQVMNWTPPPGYKTVFVTQKTGWFSGWF